MGYWDMVDTVWGAVSIYDGPEVFLAGYGAAPEPARNLLAAHWCQSEVCNGGFDQFFFNDTGVLAPEAVEGFRAIGLGEMADVVAEAMSVFLIYYPRDRDERVERLEKLDADEKFCALEERFYELMPTFEPAADAYATAHSDVAS